MTPADETELADRLPLSAAVAGNDRAVGVGGARRKEEGTQLEFGYAGHVRLTRQQYAYATVRGRMPDSFSDWQCKLIAEGWDEARIKAVTRKQSRELATITGRWNAIPAVQAQIEYERAIALETRLAEPLRAWEAQMRKYLAMAAGELPQVRSVDTGSVRWREEPGVAGRVPERVLTVEEYQETNLTALGKALEMAGRALGVFKDRTELSGPDGAGGGADGGNGTGNGAAAPGGADRRQPVTGGVSDGATGQGGGDGGGDAGTGVGRVSGVAGRGGDFDAWPGLADRLRRGVPGAGGGVLADPGGPGGTGGRASAAGSARAGLCLPAVSLDGAGAGAAGGAGSCQSARGSGARGAVPGGGVVIAAVGLRAAGRRRRHGPLPGAGGVPGQDAGAVRGPSL